MRKAYPKSMTVAELIKELQKLPQDLEVARGDNEEYPCDYMKINLVELWQVTERDWGYYRASKDSNNVKQIVIID